MSLTAIAGLVGGPLNTILERVIPDPAKRMEAELEIQKALLEGDRAQMKVNQEEAKNPSVFVSGWRPFVGWVCGFALAFVYIIKPMVAVIAAATGHQEQADTISKIEFDMGTLMTLLFGMLGMGAMRTYEKKIGVSRAGIGSTIKDIKNALK